MFPASSINVAAPIVHMKENATHPEIGNQTILAQAICLTGCISAIQA